MTVIEKPISVKKIRIGTIGSWMPLIGEIPTR